MHSKGEKLYLVMKKIRASFHLLKNLAEEMHKDLNVNASMRAVLEAIAEQDQSVPEIARKKNVSRQHIQVNVDVLLEMGLVQLQGNPAHKRSPIITLSKKGRGVFTEIRKREAIALKKMADHFTGAELGSAAATLGKLNDITVEYAKGEEL